MPRGREEDRRPARSRRIEREIERCYRQREMELRRPANQEREPQPEEQGDARELADV